ncbi:MAG: aminopeptidase P family protein [Chlamydiales bacterium]|nr:aminopeptidase P family protein [Chlamydiales bacterium]
MKLPSSLLLKKRLKALIDKLQKEKVDGCIVESPVDLHYLTGLSLSLGTLCIFKGESCLFVDGRYIQTAKEKSPVAVEMLEGKNLHSFLQRCAPKNIAFDAETTTYAEFEKLGSRFPKVKLTPYPGLLKELRLIKDSFELDAMRRSAALLWKGYRYLQKRVRKGVSEIELAREFEFFCRENGAEKLSFDPIIAFGKNSAMPHYRAGETLLKSGDIVLIDIGVQVDSYCSDMTRTLFFGTPDPKLKKWQAIVKESHDAALKICKAGVRAGALDEAAREVMKREGVEEYYLHSLGHGVGLEIHEYPRLKSTGVDKDLLLKPGMVITVEPGLYLSGKGGIRYEDTIIVTKSGYENLYPEEK